MTEQEAITRLVTSEEYARLQGLRSEFNLFALLNEAFGDTAWSRMLAGVLDSARAHALNNAALRAWVSEIVATAHGTAMPAILTDLPADFGGVPRRHKRPRIGLATSVA